MNCPLSTAEKRDYMRRLIEPCGNADAEMFKRAKDVLDKVDDQAIENYWKGFFQAHWEHEARRTLSS